MGNIINGVITGLRNVTIKNIENALDISDKSSVISIKSASITSLLILYLYIKAFSTLVFAVERNWLLVVTSILVIGIMMVIISNSKSEFTRHSKQYLYNTVLMCIVMILLDVLNIIAYTFSIIIGHNILTVIKALVTVLIVIVEFAILGYLVTFEKECNE